MKDTTAAEHSALPALTDSIRAICAFPTRCAFKSYVEDSTLCLVVHPDHRDMGKCVGRDRRTRNALEAFGRVVSQREGLAFDLDLSENLEVFRDGVAAPARRPLAPAETVQLVTRVIELLLGRKPEIVVTHPPGGTKMNVRTIDSSEIPLLTIANEICYPISMANGRRVQVYPYREGV